MLKKKTKYTNCNSIQYTTLGGAMIQYNNNNTSSYNLQIRVYNIATGHEHLCLQLLLLLLWCVMSSLYTLPCTSCTKTKRNKKLYKYEK